MMHLQRLRVSFRSRVKGFSLGFGCNLRSQQQKQQFLWWRKRQKEPKVKANITAKLHRITLHLRIFLLLFPESGNNVKWKRLDYSGRISLRNTLLKISGSSINLKNRIFNREVTHSSSNNSPKVCGNLKGTAYGGDHQDTMASFDEMFPFKLLRRFFPQVDSFGNAAAIGVPSCLTEMVNSTFVNYFSLQKFVAFIAPFIAGLVLKYVVKRMLWF